MIYVTVTVDVDSNDDDCESSSAFNPSKYNMESCIRINIFSFECNVASAIY
jgi:hypothetical protein